LAHTLPYSFRVLAMIWMNPRKELWKFIFVIYSGRSQRVS